jgi:hypothetical protein
MGVESDPLSPLPTFVQKTNNSVADKLLQQSCQYLSLFNINGLGSVEGKGGDVFWHDA